MDSKFNRCVRKSLLKTVPLSLDLKEARGEPSKYLGEECFRLRDQKMQRS